MTLWCNAGRFADARDLAKMLEEEGMPSRRLDDSMSQAVHVRYEQDTQRAIDAGVLPATVTVLGNTTNIVFTTGAASSGPRYSGTGAPYDPRTRTMVLVGGGSVLGIEFFAKVTATISPGKKDARTRAMDRERKVTPPQQRP